MIITKANPMSNLAQGQATKNTEEKGGVKVKSLFGKHAEKIGKIEAVANAAEYQYGIASMGTMTIQKQKGVKKSIGEISNQVTKLTLMLHHLEEAREAFEMHGFTRGSNKKFEGLTTQQSSDIDEFINSRTKSKICYVSYELDQKCIEEFNNCEWTDENVTKFLMDMIKIGRLYQEKTIDYAKKMEELRILESPMKYIKPLSLQKMSVKFVDGKVGIETTEPSGKNIIVIDDNIHQTRTAFANDYKAYIETVIMPEVNAADLPELVKEELGMMRFSNELHPFVDMKAYYKDIVGGFFNTRVTAEENGEEETISVASEEFKEDKVRIANMIRLATAYMNPAKRGGLMKFISGRTKGNEEAENENKFYLSICQEEFIMWLMEMELAEVPFAGYKLVNNKGYVNGDFVNFENGMAEKAILNTAFNGWAEIREFQNNFYAAIDLEDLIKAPAINNKIIIKVKQSFVREHGADVVLKALNIAKDCTLRSGGNNYNLEIECTDGKTRKVPYDLNSWFFNVLKDCSGSIVKASKNTVRTASGMEIDSVYINIDLNTIPEVKGIPMPEYDEAIGFEVVEDSDEI
jgi:hypothetical protein